MVSCSASIRKKIQNWKGGRWEVISFAQLVDRFVFCRASTVKQWKQQLENVPSRITLLFHCYLSHKVSSFCGLSLYAQYMRQHFQHNCGSNPESKVLHQGKGLRKLSWGFLKSFTNIENHSMPILKWSSSVQTGLPLIDLTTL